MIYIRAFMRRHAKTVAILAAIGVIAVAVVAYLFLFVHTGLPTPITQDETLAVGTPEFLSTFATITKSPIRTGPTPAVLNNGDEYAPALIADINAATSSIDFSTYIWKKGTFSDEVFPALTAAAKRGVQVRILFDGYAGKPPKDQLQAFQQAGGRAAFLRPFWSDPFSFDSRDHRRAIVIDGRIGYTGGMAIQDEWLGDGRSEDAWRDTMFRMQGEMAQSLESDFDDQWLVATGEVLAASPVQESDAGVTFVPVVGSAGDKNHPITDAFLLTALSAKKSLYITNPYVLPDDALTQVLMQKARSGVDVRLLVPGPHTDAKLVRFASHGYYRELLAAGVRIYEYQPSLIHEKAMIADGQWSLIGSANIDNRSREINDEDVFGIQDPALAQELTTNFNGDLQYSKEITLDAWTHRNVISRALTALSGIFYKQF